jgi:hypothetical protein
MRSFALVALLVAVAGCSKDALSPDNADGMVPSSDLSMPGPPDLAPVRSGIGDPCTSPGGFSQGDCRDDQVCIPDGYMGIVDGYCTAVCNAGSPCPSDATCINLGGFSTCLLACKTNDDCRSTDYECQDPGGGKVCLPVAGGNNGGGVKPGTNKGAACVTPVLKPGQIPGSPFGKNTQVSGGGGGASLEAETQLAVDPMNKNVVVSWNALSGRAGLGVAHSGDDGLTWDRSIALPGSTLVDKNTQQSDPVVAVDSLGTFYVGWVGFDYANQSGQPSNMHIFIAKSTDGGVTFPEVDLVSPPSEWVSGGFLDKPWVYVNPIDDSVWMTWDRQASASSIIDIRVTRSTDGGKTWSTPVAANDPGKRTTIDRNLAQIAFGENGTAYIAWVEIGQEQFGSTSNAIYLQRFNADVTKLGANVKVTRIPDSPVFEDPSVAAFQNNVYVGFISGDDSGVWDVRVAASLDGGATFAKSVKANDDPSCATHFHHQVVADSKGNVHAVWYDNRYLEGNVFYANSGPADAMNALAFGKNSFVNDVPFTFTTRRDMANWLGDYLGMWVRGSELYAAWTDNRTTNQSHIYFAKGPVP